jgi:hypothetical protein
MLALVGEISIVFKGKSSQGGSSASQAALCDSGKLQQGHSGSKDPQGTINPSKSGCGS